MQIFSKSQTIGRYVVSVLLAFALALSAGGLVVADDWTSWGLASQVGGLAPQPVAATEFNSSIYVFYNGFLSDGSSFIEMALLSHICAGASCTIPNWLALGQVPGSQTSLNASAPAAAAFNDRLYLVRSATGFAGPVSVSRIELAAMDALGTWSDWQQLPSPSFDLPGAVSDARPAVVAFGNRLYVFVSDRNGGIHATSCSSCPPGPSIWTSWQEVLSGDSQPSSPAAAVFNSQLYLLTVRGGQIWVNVMDPGGSWSGWSSTGVIAGPMPVAVAFDNQLYVITWGSDGSIRVLTQNAAGIWSSGRSISPAGFAAAPPAAAPLGSILYVFAISNSGDLLFHRETGGGPSSVADIQLIPPSIVFGSVRVGASATQTLTIQNAGGSPLTVNSISVTSAMPPLAFALLSAPSTPFTLAPNGSQSITIQFSPPAIGTFSGRIDIASNDPDESLVTVGLSGTGATGPGPGTGEISIRVDRGCGPTGASYSFGTPITISYRVSEAGTAVLYDFDPAGTLKTLPLGTAPAGVERSITATIAASQGVETVVLQVTTASGRVLAAACSFSIGGVSPTLAQITTNKGCEAAFAVGEPLTMTYSVSVPVTRVRIFNVVPGRGAVQLTPVPLTTRSGTISGMVGAQRGDRVLVVVPVTPSAGIISASCRYHVP